MSFAAINHSLVAQARHAGGATEVHYGKNNAYDLSVAIEARDAQADGKITGEEMDTIYGSMGDMEQMSYREANDFIRWGRDNYEKMSPEARQKFDKISQELQKVDPNIGSFDSKFLGAGDHVLLDKAAYERIKGEVNAIGGGKKTDSGTKPEAPTSDGVDKPDSPPAHKFQEMLTNESTNSVNNYASYENHSYDVSTQATLKKFDKLAKDGKQIGGKDMDEAIANAADGGQITREEYMDLREWVEKNYDKLSPEARAKWDALDKKVQASSGEPTWNNRHEVVLSGKEVDELLAGIKGDKKEATGTTGTSSATSASDSGSVSDPQPPSEADAPSTSVKSSSGAVPNYSGMSWDAILEDIMMRIGNKEKAAKKQIESVAKKIDGKGGKETESDRQELQKLTNLMQELQQMVNMVSNISKQLNDMNMAIIQKLAG